ncbi:14754_t:CDS:2 [Funneliformis geosporum]|uniref:10466_t:CDS:1 n=1 Tax=Funneliformis geosporum TaxID=1117311 RepID=A0A9W4SI92_9GLOM|nr:14754_t:CDS:2 [Funneliformis geosporum]CAI2169493.1 10466_t:CDS:2 [Funneliformis geosporum]
MNYDELSSFASNPSYLSRTSTLSTTVSTPLESLAITSLTGLETLIETSGELFKSLLEYSRTKPEKAEEEKRIKVTKCYENYQKVEKELKGYFDNIVELEEKKKKSRDEARAQGSTSSQSLSTEMKSLVETRDNLLQESESQETHLTNLLDQTYKLQFQIQTLLACSEQKVTQSDQQQE